MVERPNLREELRTSIIFDYGLMAGQHTTEAQRSDIQLGA